MEITFLKQSRKNHRNGESRGDIFADSNGWMHMVFQYTALMHNLKALRTLQQRAHHVVYSFYTQADCFDGLQYAICDCDMSPSFIPQVVVHHK